MPTVTRTPTSPLFLKFANPVFRFALSRGWGPTSQMMVLSWKGRKSGRSYSTPVSRFEFGDHLFTATVSGWKHNFAGGHPATLVLDGVERSVTGTMIRDPERVGAGIAHVIERLGPETAKRAMAMSFEGIPTVREFAHFAKREGVVLIEFE